MGGGHRPQRQNARLAAFSILGGSSVGGGPGAPIRVLLQDVFQYPRRIECGWWNLDFRFRFDSDRPFSILGGSSVGGGAPPFRSPPPNPSFSILGGSSVGGGKRALVEAEKRYNAFSILGGSSVGGGRKAGTREREEHDFQYPRRIECGWWLVKDGVLSADIVFQYPRRIECGWWRQYARQRARTCVFQYPRRIECGWWWATPSSPRWLNCLSVSSADRVWVVVVIRHQVIHLCLDFQYPRRIECGWWRTTRKRCPPPHTFQYPRRIECGWWPLRRGR